jgi:putative membrane protein
VDLLPALPALAGAVAYGRRVRTLRGRKRAPSSRKQLWFWLGIVVVGAALVMPEEPFAVHMTQHLLLGDVGPLLIVLGLTGAVLRPVLAVPALGRLRVLAHPLVALPLWAVAFVVWHLNGPYNAALRHPVLHGAEHFSFFVAGALMWAAIVEPIPAPAWFGIEAKALYVLVVRAIGMAIASYFIWSGTEKRTGGLIMFFEGGVVTLVVFGWLFLRWTHEAEMRQQLIEQGYDSRLARRTARHWPRLQQPPGRLRSAPSPGARDTRSE